jgi:hypothetical protein
MQDHARPRAAAIVGAGAIGAWLADVESGRQLEIAPQLGAVVEIAERLGVPAPFCRSSLGLARLLSA